MHALASGQWDELTAISTLVLAFVTATAVGVTIWLAVRDRRHDDQRKADRDNDAELRRHYRERADQVRREEDDKWERRFQAERQASLYRAGTQLATSASAYRRAAAAAGDDQNQPQWRALLDTQERGGRRHHANPAAR